MNMIVTLGDFKFRQLKDTATAIQLRVKWGKRSDATAAVSCIF